MKKAADVNIKLRVDEGSTFYLLSGDSGHIIRCFKRRFSNIEYEEIHALHSPLAGSTIELVIDGLLIGAGIIATGILSEISKDIWQSFKDLVLTKFSFGKALYRRSKRNDGIDHVTIKVEGTEVAFSGTINIGINNETELKSFCLDGFPQLVKIAANILRGEGIPGNPNFSIPDGAKVIAFYFKDGGWYLKGPLCPNCRHFNKSVTASPCSSCVYRGAKLGFQIKVKNTTVEFGPDGSVKSIYSPTGIDSRVHQKFSQDRDKDHYQPIEEIMITKTMMKTILILASNPADTSRLRLDKEVKEIDEGLRRSKYRERFVIEQRWAVNPDDWRRAMLDFEPQIVHFCGHGSGLDGLVVEDRNGNMQLLSSRALSGLFKLFSKNVECVILSACYSATQANVIASHINCVVGMDKSIGDEAAIEFAKGFYDALGAGRSYEDAHKFGCNAIDMQGIPEYQTPKFVKK